MRFLFFAWNGRELLQTAAKYTTDNQGKTVHILEMFIINICFIFVICKKRVI